MRKGLLALTAVLAALAATATATGEAHAAHRGQRVVRESEPDTRHSRHADNRDRQSGVSALVWRRDPERLEMAVERPVDGQGLRARRRLRGCVEARVHEGRGEVGLRPVQQLVRARQEEVRLRHQPDLVHRRRARRSSRSARRTTRSTRRSSSLKGTKIASVHSRRGPAELQARRASSARRATRTS